MSPVYRVRNWDEKFENNRTRELKRLCWVPIPNAQDDDAYTELVDHPDGPAHLAAWLAIVVVASKCDPRGTLLRDGGKPHDAGSLARISRLPREIFEAAIPRLIDIGSIELLTVDQAFTTAPQEGATAPQEGAQNGREGKGTKGTARDAVIRNGSPHRSAEEPPGFRRFWERYPKCERKVGRSKCLKHWSHTDLEPLADAVVSALEQSKSSHDWTKAGGEFIPLPMTWLNKTPWETDPAELAAVRRNGDAGSGFVRAPATDETIRLCLGLRADEDIPQ